MVKAVFPDYAEVSVKIKKVKSENARRPQTPSYRFPV